MRSYLNLNRVAKYTPLKHGCPPQTFPTHPDTVALHIKGVASHSDAANENIVKIPVIPKKDFFFFRKTTGVLPHIDIYCHILRMNIALYRFEFEYFFIYKTYRSVCDLVPGSICTPDSCTENPSSDSQKNMAFLSRSQQMPGILKDSKGFQHDVLLKRHQRWSSQELQNGNDDIYFIRTFQPNVICL